MVNPEFWPLALGANRLFMYAGYVMLAGTLTFWTLVWPQGRRDPRLIKMSVAGIELLALGSLIEPVLQMYAGNSTGAQLVTPIQCTALLLRFAGLAAAGFFLIDIVGYPIVGWRRLLPAAIVIVIASSMVIASNAVGGPWQTVKLIATMGHIVATAAWLGGLLALAAVLIPREHLTELDEVIPRFSIVAATSVAVLLITGTIHALATAGGIVPLIESRYGLVLGVKVTVFVVMLALGNHGRQYAARVAARAKTAGTEQMQQSGSVHSLAVVMGAELALAFVVLAITSILVFVAPGV